MKLQINKKDLLDSLNLVSKAISITTPLPALLGIKLILKDNVLTLIASDTNISIKSIISKSENTILETIEEGEMVIDGKYLVECVRRIDSSILTIETIDGNLIKIKGEKAEFEINSIDVKEYPLIQFESNFIGNLSLTNTQFTNLVNQTVFACSNKETRPVLTGVNFNFKNHKLVVSATDSYRFASKKIDIESDIEANITIPGKYLLEVIRSIGDKENLNISFNEAKIAFTFKNNTIETRLLDDAFPDTSRLMPTNITQVLKVANNALASAIDSASFIKSDGKNIIKMKISEDNMEISGFNDTISSKAQVDIIDYVGNPLEINCSGKYLEDAIKAIDSEEVILNFAGDTKPIVIKKENDDTYIQLISPIRSFK